MKIAILIASRNRPDRIERLAESLGRNVQVDADWIAVEAGTEESRLTPYTTVHYQDEEFSGFAMAHAVGMEHARELGRKGAPFDYYWVLTHDLEFADGVDPLRALVDTMEANPRLAVLAPTCSNSAESAHRAPRPEGGWRPAILSEPSGFLIRAEAVEECGFLNPAFRYGAGAMIELSHRLLQQGWQLGYSDDCSYRYVGETTYGHPGTETISASERERRARRFAYTYFLRIFGPRWAEDFWAMGLTDGIEHDAYSECRRDWAAGFTSAELADLHAACAGAPLVGAAGSEAQATVPSQPAEAPVDEATLTPWPLATEAPHRLLAWPRYDDPKDLEALLGLWSDALVDEPERCLCLRHDPALDGSLEDAHALLHEVYDRVVGEDHCMEVLFVDGEIDRVGLRRLGLAVDGVLVIPGCDDALRAEFVNALGSKELESLHELLLMARAA